MIAQLKSEMLNAQKLIAIVHLLWGLHVWLPQSRVSCQRKRTKILKSLATEAGRHVEIYIKNLFFFKQNADIPFGDEAYILHQ